MLSGFPPIFAESEQNTKLCGRKLPVEVYFSLVNIFPCKHDALKSVQLLLFYLTKVYLLKLWKYTNYETTQNQFVTGGVYFLTSFY